MLCKLVPSPDCLHGSIMMILNRAEVWESCLQTWTCLECLMISIYTCACTCWCVSCKYVLSFSLDFVCVCVICDVMWCDVMWCDVMWCDVMWCDVMWCDVMWCDVIWSAFGVLRARYMNFIYVHATYGTDRPARMHVNIDCKYAGLHAYVASCILWFFSHLTDLLACMHR